jgi:group I intron endonuclease
MGIIYKVTNEINNKIYIGQTEYSLHRRRRLHEYAANKLDDNMIFHSAIRKYGVNSFSWEIVEEVNLREELNKREIYYIKKFNCRLPNGYNILEGGGGATGWKMPEYMKIDSSNRMKGDKNPNYIHGNTSGIHYCIEKDCNRVVARRGNRCKSCAQKGERNNAKNPEVRAKLRIILSGSGNGMYGKPNPKRSELNKLKRKEYIIISPEGIAIITKDLREFCEEHDLKKDGMSAVANDYYTQHKGGWVCLKTENILIV